MPQDAQSLLTLVSSYVATGNVSGVSLLKLALLQQIALSLNPMADTSAQGLLSLPAIGGYAATSNASTCDLLELALLNLIAASLTGGGSGGVPGVYIGNYGGVQPVIVPAPTNPSVAYDTSGGQFWTFDGTLWYEVIA